MENIGERPELLHFLISTFLLFIYSSGLNEVKFVSFQVLEVYICAGFIDI
jgi:hypothetical protein